MWVAAEVAGWEIREVGVPREVGATGKPRANSPGNCGHCMTLHIMIKFCPKTAVL